MIAIRNLPIWRLEMDRNYETQCRAADWNLSAPDWTGRMRVMEKNKKVAKTEDCSCISDVSVKST